eukprot:scaffold22589_cov138-Cylindrotheca_fusiformis.AAC.8
MANRQSKGFFARLVQTFHSNCGDDDVWADLSPWELCATPLDVEPKSEIPRVVSIVDEGSDMVSDINENRHAVFGKQSRDPAAIFAEVPQGDNEPSAIFAMKRRRKKKASKEKERDSPPSHHSRNRLPVTGSRSRRSSPPKSPPETRRVAEKGHVGVPQNIYIQPKVPHYIVRV